MTEYPNWFQGFEKSFATHLIHLRDQPGARLLQIGAYIGDATTWLLDNIATHPTSVLIDVDTWQGSDEAAHHILNWTDVWGTYLDRIAGRRVIPYRMTSDEYFHIRNPASRFHFIYIDGDHTREQVARDAYNADKALTIGGVLAFDDYTWTGHHRGQNPRDAINPFLQEEGSRYTVLEMGAQVWMKKNTERARPVTQQEPEQIQMQPEVAQTVSTAANG